MGDVCVCVSREEVCPSTQRGVVLPAYAQALQQLVPEQLIESAKSLLVVLIASHRPPSPAAASSRHQCVRVGEQGDEWEDGRNRRISVRVLYSTA